LAPSSTLLLLAPTSALPLLPSHFKLSVLYWWSERKMKWGR
jgi:hypothetical protein